MSSGAQASIGNGINFWLVSEQESGIADPAGVSVINA